MAVSLSRFSWWLWSGKEKEGVDSSVKLRAKNLSPPKKVKKKWQSREERRSEKKYGEGVLGASDGEILASGSESDGPDWSIGWVEPHGVGFGSDEEGEDGFAVLVPCYKSGCKKLVENSNNLFLNAIKNLPNEFSSEGKKNGMEWLSSLQNF